MVFELFTYQFEPIGSFIREGDLFAGDVLFSIEEKMKLKNKLLEEFFRGGVIKSKDKVYTSQIEVIEDVIQLRIANIKHVKVERDFTKHEIDSYPSIFVFIDNNPLMQRMGIQVDKRAFNKTSAVQHILSNAINEFLEPYGIKFVLKREIISTEFWGIIDQYRNSITKVIFNISFPNLPRIQSKMTDNLKELSKLVNSTKNTISLGNENGISISEDNEEIKSLNNACSDAGNPVQIQVKGQGIKRTGNTAKITEVDPESLPEEHNPGSIITFIKRFFENA